MQAHRARPERPRAGRHAQRGACAAAAVALSASALAGCGGESYGAGRHGDPYGTARARAAEGLDAPFRLAPPRPAHPIALRDPAGRRVSLAAFRGRAVLLTFVYGHCPDVCPLIVAKLHTALGLLGGREGEAQVVAVSVDPRGDTPASVNAFIAEHRMTGRMEYLIGSLRALAPVWRAWGIAVGGSPSAREVDHTAAVFGIDGRGDVAALYPANFLPRAIAHDVPLLAAS